MEMGSGSLTDSGGSSTNSSTESLNCLKFGQKIYFENTSSSSIAPGTVASANTGSPPPPPPPKSGPGSSSSSGSGKKPKSGRMVQNGQPPRCQVEGCKVDLSDAKAYYSRHKVCSMHSKSPKVIVAGLEQRFCQQCSRFHQLPEFDQGKRSCRRRLAGHNERRRKPPPGSLLSFVLAGFLRRSPTTAVEAEALSWISRLTRGFPEGKRCQQEEHRSTYPEIKMQLRDGYFHINGKTTQRILHHLTFSCRVHWAGLVFLVPGFLLENASRELLPRTVLSLFCQINHRASALGVNDMMNTELSHSMSQPALPHGAVMNPYSDASWGFKGNGSGSSSRASGFGTILGSY